VGQCIRGDILGNDGVAGDEGAAADPAELVHGYSAADEGLIADMDVSSEHAAIGEDDVRSDYAVMGDVASRHQETLGADEGVFSGFGRSMNRHVLTDDRSVADERSGSSVYVEGKVLRIAADDCEVVDLDTNSELGAGLDDGMGRDAAAWPEHRAGFDNRERSYLDVGGESGGRMDLGGRMNHFGELAPPNSSS
jgi:hypothetical protein